MLMTPAYAAGHVNNPYQGADVYHNEDYAQEIEQSIHRVHDAALVAAMRQLQHMPTAIWLDRIEAIAGGTANSGRASLEQHLNMALQQQANRPMVVELVLYNLPDRDCSAMSSNGTLSYRNNGLMRYQHDYIDVIARLTSEPRFSGLRFVFIVEPDSLPNMVTNLWNKKCAAVYQHKVYQRGIQYAVEQLSGHDNHYIYLDVGHSGWLGWDETLQKTVAFIAETVRATKPGLSAVDGFVTNISGSTPVEEPFLDNPSLKLQGKPVRSDSFYAWNRHFDEKDYIERLDQEFIAAGFPEHIRFLIDTSRNGWGGRYRPRQRSAADDVRHYVNESRIDRRFHRGNWCNPSGAGLGPRPQVSPYGEQHPVAAFIWVKPPGESDGTSDARQQEPDSEGKRYDPMCDPDYVVDYGPAPSRLPTGALPDAPPSGHWFHQQFLMLINNAWPPLLAPHDK